MRVDIRRIGTYLSGLLKNNRQSNTNPEKDGLYSLCSNVYQRMVDDEDVFDELVFLFRRRGRDALDTFNRVHVEKRDEALLSHAYEVSQRPLKKASSL